jgi:hypothetical protein
MPYCAFPTQPFPTCSPYFLEWVDKDVKMFEGLSNGSQLSVKVIICLFKIVACGVITQEKIACAGDFKKRIVR